MRHWVGSFNGDRFDDIASLSDQGELFVQLSGGPGVGFLATGNRSWLTQVDNLFAQRALDPDFFVGVGDFNGDGRDDLITLQDQRWVIYQSELRNQGSTNPNLPEEDGFRRVATNDQVLVDLHRIVVGDFDGDGIDDVAGFDTTDATNQWFVWRGIDDSQFAQLTTPMPNVDLETGETWGAVAPNTGGWDTALVADINGDTRDDIAMLNTQPIQRVDGLETFGRWYILLAESSPLVPFVLGRQLADRFSPAIATDALLLTSGEIVGASNTSPVEVTTLTPHGLSTGDQVYIQGILGNTAANGPAQITVTGPNTYTLNNRTGSGQYLGGGSWTASEFDRHQVVDFNGDGRNDIASFDLSSNAWVGIMSGGESLATRKLLDPVVSGVDAAAVETWNWFLGNFDNDKAGSSGIGTDDLLSYEPATGVFRAYIVASDFVPIDEELASVGIFEDFGTSAIIDTNDWKFYPNVGGFDIASGGRAQPQQTFGPNLMIRTRAVTQDVRISARIDIHAGQPSAPGLVTRYIGQGDRNMYWGTLVVDGAGAASLQVWRCNEGNWTQVASQPTSSPLTAGTVTLTFEVEGNELRLDVLRATGETDRLRIYDLSSDAILEPGLTGLRQWAYDLVPTYHSVAMTSLVRSVFTDSFARSEVLSNSLGNDWTPREVSGYSDRADLRVVTLASGEQVGALALPGTGSAKLSKIATVDAIDATNVDLSADIRSFNNGDAMVLVARQADDLVNYIASAQMVMAVVHSQQLDAADPNSYGPPSAFGTRMVR